MSRGWRVGTDVAPPRADEPDWIAARPPEIARALDRALSRPTGGWYVLDATRRVGARPQAFQVDGRHLVAWRDERGLVVAPEACPHMGASLVGARVCDGAAVCPWHGLRLGRDGHGSWDPFPSHDDGVLAWVQLAGDEAPTDAPILAPRPERYLDGVIRIEARCEPRDVIANRLDPWHGVHFHPYSFASLEVLEKDDDALKVRVQKRIVGPLRVEVEAVFHSPDPRTIVMTITGGEGVGSVVETHATPIDDKRCAVVEATLATSDRKGFQRILGLARFIRPFIERSARRLWVDDAAYAERLFELRERGWRVAGDAGARARERSGSPRS